jgi:hypothetical protein
MPAFAKIFTPNFRLHLVMMSYNEKTFVAISHEMFLFRILRRNYESVSVHSWGFYASDAPNDSRAWVVMAGFWGGRED